MPIDPENYIPPSCYDVLITDISDKDLEQVAKEFESVSMGLLKIPVPLHPEAYFTEKTFAYSFHSQWRGKGRAFG